jgi:hypothetical protein
VSLDIVTGNLAKKRSSGLAYEMQRRRIDSIPVKIFKIVQKRQLQPRARRNSSSGCNESEEFVTSRVCALIGFYKHRCSHMIEILTSAEAALPLVLKQSGLVANLRRATRLSSAHTEASRRCNNAFIHRDRTLSRQSPIEQRYSGSVQGSISRPLCAKFRQGQVVPNCNEPLDRVIRRGAAGWTAGVDG